MSLWLGRKGDKDLDVASKTASKTGRLGSHCSCTQITNVGALIIRGFGGYVVAFSLLELPGPKKFKLSKIELKGQKT